MATLADINNELSMQGNVLEDTRDSIASVASTVRKQFEFFTSERELQDLETAREARPTTPAVNVSSAGGAGGFSGGDLLAAGGRAGLIAGITDFLLGAAKFMLTRALKLIRAGAAIVFFPFIQNFADDIAKEIVDFSAEVLDGVFDFKITDAQKQDIRQTISSGLSTSIVGLLFGLGARRSLLAGLIAAGFTQLEQTFPQFKEDALQYLRDIGLGKIADQIENNPETSKTALSLGLAILAPAVLTLGLKVIGGILTALGASLASLPIAVVAGAIGIGTFTYKYYTDEEFRRRIDETLNPIREAVFEKARELENYVLSSLRNIKDRLINFIFGVDNESFFNDPRQAEVQELENQLEAARRAKNAAVAAATSGAEKTAAIMDVDDTFGIGRLQQQIKDLKNDIRKNQYTANMIEKFGAPTNEDLVVAGAVERALSARGLAVEGSMSGATIQAGLEAQREQQYRQYEPPSTVTGDINSKNTTNNITQSTNILGSLGNTQDSWEIDEEIARRSRKMFN